MREEMTKLLNLRNKTPNKTQSKEYRTDCETPPDDMRTRIMSNSPGLDSTADEPVKLKKSAQRVLSKNRKASLRKYLKPMAMRHMRNLSETPEPGTIRGL